MKRNRLLALALPACPVLAGLLLVGAASARTNVGSPVRQTGTGHTIAVVGHGQVQVSPDMATISIGVQTHDNTAQAALASNATKMNAVIAAVQGQGVPADHIKTSDLSLWYDNQKDQYVVSHSLSVRVDNVSTVGTVLDAAVNAGANMSWGVSFGLKDESAADNQALTAAVNNARTRATTIAGALGVSLSGVGSASEPSYNVVAPQPIYAGASRAAASAPSTPVQAGQLTITAEVNVVYTFG